MTAFEPKYEAALALAIGVRDAARDTAKRDADYDGYLHWLGDMQAGLFMALDALDSEDATAEAGSGK